MLGLCRTRICPVAVGLGIALFSRHVLVVDAACQKGMLITGIVDGKSGEPKGVEIYVLKVCSIALCSSTPP